MKKLMMIGSAVALLASGHFVQAQGGGFDVDAVFGRWDTDANGTVSKDEFDNRPRRAAPAAN